MADETTIAWLQSIQASVDRGFHEQRLVLELKADKADLAAAVQPLATQLASHAKALRGLETRQHAETVTQNVVDDERRQRGAAQWRRTDIRLTLASIVAVVVSAGLGTLIGVITR